VIEGYSELLIAVIITFIKSEQLLSSIKNKDLKTTFSKKKFYL